MKAEFSTFKDRALAEQQAALMQLKKPSAIIFDWDGTLMKHYGLEKIAAEEMINKHLVAGINRPTPEELLKAWHTDRAGFYQRFFGAHSPQARERVDRWWFEIESAIVIKTPELLDGATELLAQAKDEKILAAVASNRRQSTLDAIVEKLALQDFFAAIRGAPDFDAVAAAGERLDQRKPAPDILISAVKALGIPMENIWMVGDTVDDMGAARSDGFQRILVGENYRDATRTRFEKNDPAGSIIYLDNLHQLREMLAYVTKSRALGGGKFV